MTLRKKKIMGKRFAAGVFLTAVLVTVTVSLYYFQHKRTISLGFFTGSAWDVPDAYTYQLIDDAVEKFEAEHPGVKVKFVSGIQKDDYSEYIASALIKGNAPDVFFVLPEDFSTFAGTDALMKLDGYIDKDVNYDKSRYYKASFEFGNISGSQYGIPFESVPQMMFVNKTLLKNEGINEIPEDWTWEEFYEICDRVTKDTDGNGIEDQFGVCGYTWQHAFITNGVDVFDANGTSCNLLSENAVEAVDFIKKINGLTKGNIVKADDFDKGNVAFMPALLSDYRTYKPYPWNIKKYTNFELDCITLPRGENGDNKSTMSTLLLAMNSRTNNEGLAWELIKTFCYDAEIQSEIYTYKEGASVLKTVTDSMTTMLSINQVLSEEGGMDINLIIFIMDHAEPDYNFKDITSVREMIDAGIDDIVNNGTDSKIGLQMTEKKVRSFLKE